VQVRICGSPRGAIPWGHPARNYAAHWKEQTGQSETTFWRAPRRSAEKEAKNNKMLDSQGQMCDDPLKDNFLENPARVR